MYVDPNTRQTYDYANSIACDNNPKNIIELDPDSDYQEVYILGPEPNKRKPPLMLTPSQTKTTQPVLLPLHLSKLNFKCQNSIIFENATIFLTQNKS